MLTALLSACHASVSYVHPCLNNKWRVVPPAYLCVCLCVCVSVGLSCLRTCVLLLPATACYYLPSSSAKDHIYFQCSAVDPGSGDVTTTLCFMELPTKASFWQ